MKSLLNIKNSLTFHKEIVYNLRVIAQIVKKRTGGGSCEKNISTEQKKTPKSPRFQSPHENGRRP